MREALEAQDCCYTLVTRSPNGSKAQVIGSIVDFVYAPEDRKACVERLASPQCKIVSLTVTEKGYLLLGALQFRSPNFRSPNLKFQRAYLS